MKKQWVNPELKNLNSTSTKEVTCYCEDGPIAAYGAKNTATV